MLKLSLNPSIKNCIITITHHETILVSMCCKLHHNIGPLWNYHHILLSQNTLSQSSITNLSLRTSITNSIIEFLHHDLHLSHYCIYLLKIAPMNFSITIHMHHETVLAFTCCKKHHHTHQLWLASFIKLSLSASVVLCVIGLIRNKYVLSPICCKSCHCIHLL